jgi:hypothetical protein
LGVNLLLFANKGQTMNNIILTDEQILLVSDVIFRAQGDFEDHIYDDTIEGYASCSMLQMSYRIKKLLDIVIKGSTKPIIFDASTQRMEFIPEIDADKGSIQ